MNPFLYMLCLTLCSFFLLGCKSVNTIKPSDTLSKKAFIEDVRVVTDPFLQSRAKVLGINETLTEGGFLKIQVELENLTPRTKHVEYLFEWFDKDGNLIPSTTRSYRVRELLGRETIFLQAVSPTDQASDFRLKMIRARR